MNAIADLPLFAHIDPPGRRATPLRLPSPSAPGSSTSADQARANDASGRTGRQLRRVLVWFASQSEGRTRHDCAAALYTGPSAIASVCGRVNELVFRGWLQVVGREAKRELLAITESGLREARAVRT